MSSSASAAAAAYKNFEEANQIMAVDDRFFNYDEKKHLAQCTGKPWRQDVRYFKNVKMSALALIKIVMHARGGGDLEVMGMMQGYIDGDTIIVTDSFALPVEGTETRVNAQAEAFEYMVGYLESMQRTGRTENCVGWYHSHPGYKCWLSGIDVNTQSQNQAFQDPWLAVVVDPKTTMASGRVEIGAFRTYPDGYEPKEEANFDMLNMPANKVEEFGVHMKKYYPLPMSFFKSSVDTQLINLLWSKYWVNTLAASPLVANRAYNTDSIGTLVDKMAPVEKELSYSGRFGMFGQQQKKEPVLSALQRDSSLIATETLQALMNQVVKDFLFNPQRRRLQPRRA